MNSKFVNLKKYPLAIAILMGLSSVNAQTLPGKYTTSWIGNTEGTETDHIMQTVDQLYVAPNGYVAAVTGWDEGGHNVMGFSSDGNLQCDPQDCGTGSWGRMSGRAITYDGTYIYQVMSQKPDGSRDNVHYPSTGTWNTIARYNATGRNNSYAGFTNGMGHALHSIVLNTDGAESKGLVVYNNELYVAIDNEMHVYQLPLASQSSKRTWVISDPGQLQVDGQGYIWMLQPTNKKIIRYSTTGALQSQSISVIDNFSVGFGIDKANNKMYITNNNTDQNIVIFSNINTTPTATGTFGVKGGILSGSGETIGTVGPLRFNNPVGVGVDDTGNIYVACNGTSYGGGGAAIEKYTAAGTRVWYKYGLEFIDCAEPAASSETDVFTKEEHFVMNYGNTAVGTEQNYKGFTINRKKYPQDARLHKALGGVWVREFNGKRFLYISDMFSDALAIYRFNSTTDGETAIPCGYFAKKHIGDADNGKWPANQPANNAWIWNDTNGNGNYDTGEYTSYAGNFSSWGWNIDNKGAIWIANDDGNNRNIYKFPCQGLDANGSPKYNFTSMKSDLAPAIFTELSRIDYDATNDQMYLGGYTLDYPHLGTAWGRLGREIVRIDNWTTGNRNVSKRYGSLPDDSRGDAAIKEMSISGDYVFTINCFQGLVDIYDKASGAKVGTLSPQNIGGFGWVDMPASIRAYKRSNGEYLIFVEEDGYIKVVMYRWCPTGDCKEIPTAVNEEKQSQLILTLHPNPAKAELYLSGRLVVNAYYEITSIEGKTLQAGLLSGSSITIDNLKAGLYLLKIKTDVGTSVQRFVKE